MKYPVLLCKNTNLKNFIDFWSKRYEYSQADIYDARINKKKLNTEDILELYKWKNGGKLSQKKLASVKRIAKKLNVINKLKSKYDAEIFEEHFKKMTAIWKIFLRHIILPKKFPIFDQHVYRAHHYLITGKVKEIKASNKLKEIVYIDYAAFFNAITKKGLKPKKVDEALWAFGKFLKSNYREVLRP